VQHHRLIKTGQPHCGGSGNSPALTRLRSAVLTVCSFPSSCRNRWSGQHQTGSKEIWGKEVLREGQGLDGTGKVLEYKHHVRGSGHRSQGFLF